MRKMPLMWQVTCLLILCVSCSTQPSLEPANHDVPNATLSVTHVTDRPATPAKTIIASTSAATRTIKPSKSQTATEKPLPRHTLMIPTPTPTAFVGDDITLVSGKVKPPAGLVYKSASSAWVVNSSDIAERVYDYQQTNSEYFEQEVVKISPDRKYLTMTSYTGINDHTIIIEIDTGNIIKDYSLANGDLPCDLQWWVQRPEYMVGKLLHPKASLGYVCRGGAALIKNNGDMIVLPDFDDRYEDYGLPSVATDGRRIVFSNRGEPWIYEFGAGKYSLLWKKPEIDGLKDIGLLYPAWSPSMRRIAWVFVSRDEVDNTYSGLAVLDILTGKTDYFYPYAVGNYDGGGTSIRWLKDEQYLYVYSPGFNTSIILTIENGATTSINADRSAYWNPPGTAYAITKEKQTSIGYFDEKEAHVVCDGFGRVWSPDGKWLVIGNSYRNFTGVTYLLDQENRLLYELDLPTDAIVFDWLPD